MSRLNSSGSAYRPGSRVSTGRSNLDALRTKISSARQVRTRDMEDFLIVWLNFHNDQFDPNNLVRLRQILNSIKKFINPDQCLDYLKEIKFEKVFLISSNPLNDEQMSLIDQMSQIHSFYILSEEKFFISFPWKKLKGIFKNIEQISDELTRELHQSQNDLTPISLVTVQSIEHFQQLDQSFMYAQLIKEILLQMNFDQSSKENFTEFCRIQYADNQDQLDSIDEFEKSYRSNEAIRWYKRKSFVTFMLNKALRTQDTEVILKMAFYIRDLHREIEKSPCETSKIFVYRGQSILNLEFTKLCQSKGGLLSFNNFVVTSRNRQRALKYLETARENRHVTSIVFEIEIDSSVASCWNSFLSIEHANADENEILFSMHSIFRIDQMKQIDERLWQVNLTFPRSNDRHVTKLIDYVHQVTREEIGMHRMAKLMLVIDQIDKAQEIYSALLQTTDENDDKELAYLTYQLGYISEQKGNLVEALNYYEQSLVYHQSYLPENDPELCPTYSNIGLILKKQGFLDEAREYFQQALDISLAAEKSDRLEIALRYNHLGSVFDAQGQSSKALENYQRALDIELDHLPKAHPLIGATHNNIGMVFYSIKDYSSALDHFQKTLEIEEKSFSRDHPSLVMTYTNLVGVLENLQQYDKALEYAEKAAHIVALAFSLDHPQVAFWQEYIRQLREKQ